MRAQMKIVETSWPEVKELLAPELADDRYVCWRLEHPSGRAAAISVTGERDARNVLTVGDAPFGLVVWLEARDGDARELLRSLPAGKELQVMVGNGQGLELVQQELTGTVSVGTLFCMVDRQRFRVQRVRAVTELTHKDRPALERYPSAGNTGVFFSLFDEGKVDVCGCYEGEEIVGFGVLFPGSNETTWMDVRPEWRGRGYGRSLLSWLALEMLKTNDVVIYEACMETLANVRTCLACGFVPTRQTFIFSGRRGG